MTRRLGAFRLVFLALVLSAVSCAAASVAPQTTADGKLRCSISANARHFQVGDRFRVSVRVENVSTQVIWLYFPAVYQPGCIAITDEHGLRMKGWAVLFGFLSEPYNVHRLGPGEAYEESIKAAISYEFVRASQGPHRGARYVLMSFGSMELCLPEAGKFRVAFDLTTDEKTAKTIREGVGPIWLGTLHSNELNLTIHPPTRRNLDRTIAQISSEDEAVALRAIGRVSANCDRAAVSALLRVLGSERGALVRPAAGALIRIQDTSLLPQLESLYHTTRQGEIQRIVLETMQGLELGDRVASLLVETVRSGVSWESRQYAAREVGMYKIARGADALIAAAREEEQPVRYSAIDGLGLLGQTQDVTLKAKIVAVLLDLLKNDPDRTIRGRAASALGQIADPSTIPALIAALRDSDNFAGADADDALRRFAGREALEPLREYAATAEEESQRQTARGAISEIEARLQHPEGQ